MQSVPQIFKKMPLRIHQNTPFQARNSVFSGEWRSPLIEPRWSPILAPTKPPGSASAFPKNSSYRFTSMVGSVDSVRLANVTHPAFQYTSSQ